MRKRITILNYASIAGLAAFAVYIAIYYVLGLTPMGGVGYAVWLIPSGIFYLGIKKYREEEKEGFIDIPSVFGNGVLFAFVYASMVSMLLFMYSQYDGSLVQEGVGQLLEEFGKNKEAYLEAGSKEEYQLALDILEAYGSVLISIGIFMNLFFANVISSLAIAFIVKKERPNFTDGV